MLKKFFIFLFLGFIVFNLVFIFVFTNIWKDSALNTINIWLYKVVLSIVPIYILSSLLLAIFNYLKFKERKNNGYFENNKALTLFILSFLCGNPTSIILIKEAYEKNEISINQANRLFKSSSHISFLFVIMVFGFNEAFYLIISQIIATLLIYFFDGKKNRYQLKLTNYNILEVINSVIDNLPLILLKILSSMLIVTLIKVPFSHLNFNLFNIIFNFFEVSTGLVEFSNIDNNYLKLLLSSILLSINGVAILLQIFNVIKKTKLSYQSFLLSRFIHALISSIISLVLYFIF